MENLLASRTMKDQGTSRLQNLSPEKYGKSAYANLSYTPSKLADNILFKQVTTQKKMEEGTSKLRQSQALNSVFKDRLSQLEEERDGIQKSLTSQIVMYKKMLHEMEQKHELRIKSIQENFNIEMQRLLDQKQEEAKYAQSEKELLQNRIYELQEMVANLRNDLSNVDGNYENMKNEKQKLEIKLANLQKRLEQTQKQAKLAAEKAKSQNQELQRKLYSTQADWKNKFEKALHEKDKQRQNLQRLHRTELQKLEHKRAQQALLKNQQFKQLAATFEKETNRLNDIINKKQQIINKLNQLLENQKQKAFNQSKSYQNQINNLTHQKLRYKDQLSKADLKNEKIQVQIADVRTKMAQQKASFQSYTDKLKQQLELNQVNFIRQRDRNVFMSEDLQNQITRLRIQNDAAGSLAGENAVLHKQLRNMKDLLLESSLQMERCKEQFVRLGRQKDKLSIRLRQISIQNQTLHRIKNEREDQARGWRESYYIQKNRS